MAEEPEEASGRRLITKDELAKAAATILIGETALREMARLDGCCTQGCCNEEVLALLD
jgi:hypothetical protein